jgi:exopolysaccharide biosynthesis WecB/TagA/CpsF family protein
LQALARIEGIDVNLATLDQAVDQAAQRAGRGDGFLLFTLNLDHLVKLDEPAFRSAYMCADLVSADGFPIVWLARRQGAVLDRVCGSDMVLPLMARAANDGLPVYVVGPGPEAQARALKRLHAQHPGLKIAGAETPMVPAAPQDDPAFVEALARRIAASDARLVLLCLGAPKQELLAAALADRVPQAGFLCVGAALDFIAGEVSRAPAWVQRLNGEWLWRLAGDPKRLGLRYWRSAVKFADVARRRP